MALKDWKKTVFSGEHEYAGIRVKFEKKDFSERIIVEKEASDKYMVDVRDRWNESVFPKTYFKTNSQALAYVKKYMGEH
jgi:hypothetical protein